MEFLNHSNDLIYNMSLKRPTGNNVNQLIYFIPKKDRKVSRMILSKYMTLCQGVRINSCTKNFIIRTIQIGTSYI